MIPASIPSPSTGNLHLGPFTIHMYGVMLLLGIVAAIALTGYRWTRHGGTWDLVYRAALWGVAAGIVGARLYHDVTSWNEVPHPGGGRSPSGRAGSASGAGSPSASSPVHSSCIARERA